MMFYTDDNNDKNKCMCVWYQDIFSELDLEADEDALRELKQANFLHSKQASGTFLCSSAGCVYLQPAEEQSAP